MNAKHLEKMFERINNDVNVIIDFEFINFQIREYPLGSIILMDEPEILVNQEINRDLYYQYKNWYTLKYNELEYLRQREISLRKQDEINSLLKILNYKFEKISELYFT